MKKYALLCVIGLLSACGFHLRGMDASQFAISEIAIEARNRYGQTAKQLQEALQKRQVEVRAGAFPTLVLVEEKQSSRALGRGGSAQTNEIELLLELDWQLLGKNRLLLSEDSLQVRRIYLQDDNNIAAGSGEQDQLEVEMRRELIEQLLLRLQALTPQTLDSWQRRAEQKQAEEEALRRQRALDAAEAQ
ncbi:hypothetical protein AXE65_11290 [Ventosimonas gracilis]|uniref:LPS-assembly lipoprotein LptE n=1 Tax=Ventosimonas gracilis TaxID=1680762 RepID=A0A139SWT8_9GAMM|nr:LPS assembly lipoprotein LptE [Ventosimonas gracilis]KXU38892.1 hypothetical protein AXE65_11290 [Ventosimonas gracilis]